MATTTKASARREAGGMSFQYPTLTRSNYIAWAMRTKAIMRAEGVWQAIEPTGMFRVKDDRAERMALAAIYQGIPDDAVLSLVGKATARQAWEALERMYLGDAGVREAKVRTLMAELEVLRMEESESICDLAWKVRRILGTIRFLGADVEDSVVITRILVALPRRFASMVTMIDIGGKMMTVEKVIGRLQVYEEMLLTRGR